MAETSTVQLIEMGYKNVYNLEGGMNAWEAAGKKLEIKEVKEFDIIAKQWSFEPSIIEVSKGDRVKLNLESVDVAHGIYIPQFKIGITFNPGEKKEISFIAEEEGEFNFFCNVPCGMGHGSMNGKLIVK
jgi:cytochrome c oxidase subunit 2